MSLANDILSKLKQIKQMYDIADGRIVAPVGKNQIELVLDMMYLFLEDIQSLVQAKAQFKARHLKELLKACEAIASVRNNVMEEERPRWELDWQTEMLGISLTDL